MYHVCAVPAEAIEGIGSSGTIILEVVVSHHMSPGIEPWSSRTLAIVLNY